MNSKELLDDLKWRGLISSRSGNLEEMFNNPTSFYVGCDPTGDSLHVGHLLAFTTAKLLQRYGHKPYILVGSFTARIGDPSFKDKSRPEITNETVTHNALCIEKQLRKLIDFTSVRKNCATLVDNNAWLGKMSFSDFMSGPAKMITVNYMMAKESVKKRLSREGEGISLCEFLYMCCQGYDFLHLYETYDCKMQCGGQDQFGNCTVGTEFIRRKLGKTDTAVLTWPLVTRADGTKFGKSEGGKNIWLDPVKTTPYEFYQFWLNQSDEDAEKFIKMFTLIDRETIERMMAQHKENPSKRLLQKELGKYMTIMVHSEEDYNKAVEASNILFGKSTTEQLKSIDEKTLLDVFKDVPQHRITITNESNITDIACECNELFSSKNDFRKLVKGGGVSMNKEKITNPNQTITRDNLLNDKYLLLQKGKRYCLVIAD